MHINHNAKITTRQEAQIESVSLGWACKHTKLNELACLASL